MAKVNDNDLIDAISNLWREHAAKQTEEGRETTPETFVYFLELQGWIDDGLVNPEAAL